MTCEFTHLDGSYVLGALSPAERQEFETHLASCTECARAVRELAGLPGLLARVDPEVLADPPAAGPVPETLLPALVQHVRRSQRRRVLVTVGAAAAAALVVVAGSLGVARALEDGTAPSAAPPTPSSSAAPPVGHSMVQVGNVPVSASLALTGVLWGTRLDLTCSYAGGGEYGTPPTQTYAMFIHTRDGKVLEVATWRALPGKTMRLEAATATSRTDITSVEVRNATGTPVLKLVA